MSINQENGEAGSHLLVSLWISSRPFVEVAMTDNAQHLCVILSGICVINTIFIQQRTFHTFSLMISVREGDRRIDTSIAIKG